MRIREAFRLLSPHAPFSFDMAPVGYQWFSLRDSTPEARLAGVQAAAPILDAFIDARNGGSVRESKGALVRGQRRH